MSRIIGIERKSFTPKDGDRPIEGSTFHVTEKIASQHGEGCSADRFFLSKAKLGELDFVPSVGADVEILYNKYGKVRTLRLLSDGDSDFEV